MEDPIMTEEGRTPASQTVAEDQSGGRLPWATPTLSRLGTGETAIACLPGPEGICTTSTTAS
jgi:hypothetical protein